MASLQGKYLTFENVESPLDAEEKLFQIKLNNNDKLTIESIPTQYPGQVWYWIDLQTGALKFMEKKAREAKKKKQKKKSGGLDA